MKTTKTTRTHVIDNKLPMSNTPSISNSVTKAVSEGEDIVHAVISITVIEVESN